MKTRRTDNRDQAAAAQMAREAPSSGGVTARPECLHRPGAASDAEPVKGNSSVAAPVAGAPVRRTRADRHGAYRSGGGLPPRLAWMRPEIDAFRAGLVCDLGGEPTTAQSALVEQAVRLLTVVLLLTWNVFTRGGTTRKGELRPAIKALATYENSLRLALLALGLERRAKQVDLDLRALWSRSRAEGPPEPSAAPAGPEVLAAPHEPNRNTAGREGEGLA